MKKIFMLLSGLLLLVSTASVAGVGSNRPATTKACTTCSCPCGDNCSPGNCPAHCGCCCDN